MRNQKQKSKSKIKSIRFCVKGGNVAAGSLFASLQSAGAAGFSAWASAGYGAVDTINF